MKEIIKEFREHIPFTALATIFAILLVFLIQYLVEAKISGGIFEILHPLHVIASAIVTAGIFYKYKKNFFQALLVGLIGSILIGSLSDIILPYFGGNLLNLKTSFHLPLIEEPLIILLSAIIGGIIGISTRITKMPHFIHVFISVFASLFYLLAFSTDFNLLYSIGAFLIVFISVIIPCCLSDIIFPFLFLQKRIKRKE